MLKRLALTAPLDQFAERVGFRRSEWALEVQIELHARHFEEVGKQRFRVEAR